MKQPELTLILFTHTRTRTRTQTDLVNKMYVGEYIKHTLIVEITEVS